MTTPPGTEPRLGDLVASATADVQSLVRSQIELTKVELTDSAKRAATGSGMFVVAGVLAFLAFVFLLVTAAYGLVALGLPVWAGFLIVAVVLIVVAVVLVLVGRSQVQKVKGPERAKAALEETKAALTQRKSGATV